MSTPRRSFLIPSLGPGRQPYVTGKLAVSSLVPTCKSVGNNKAVGVELTIKLCKRDATYSVIYLLITYCGHDFHVGRAKHAK